MDQINTSLKDKFYKSIMPVIYNLGAAVVILGAMFKLLNLPGGSLMLGIGLSAEAFIFLLSAFEPKPEEKNASASYPIPSPDDQDKWMHYMHQIEAMTHTLSDMNGLYKKSLDDTSRLYDHLNTALKSMEEASSQAAIFKKELTALNEKITALNDIYTKTLNAFKR